MIIRKPANYKSHDKIVEDLKWVLVISHTDTPYQLKKDLYPAFLDISITDTDEYIKVEIS